VELLYEHGDDGYDRIRALWVSEGSAASFEEIGTFGGRIWRAIGWKRETYPQFALAVSDGPTSLDTSDDQETVGRVTSSGYLEEMLKTGGVEVRSTNKGLTLKYANRPLRE